MLPGIAIALPGGMLGQRFGAKRVVLIGLALMALGGAHDGAELVVRDGWRRAALICGTGAVLFNVLVTKMITDWFAGREIVDRDGDLRRRAGRSASRSGSWSSDRSPSAYGWSAVMHLGALAALAALRAGRADLSRSARHAPAASATGLQLDLTRREWVLVLIAGVDLGRCSTSPISSSSASRPSCSPRAASRCPRRAASSACIGWVLIPSIPLSGFVVERIGRPNLFMIGGPSRSPPRALVALPFVDAPLVALRARRARDRRAGRPDHGAARAGAAAGIARRRHGRFFHLLLRRDGCPARRRWTGARSVGQCRRRPHCSPPR